MPESPAITPKRYTRAVLGKRALLGAKRLIARVRAATDDETKTMFFCSACVFYMRPFTQSHGIGRLEPDAEVPSEHRETHNSVRDYRNEFAAHADSRRNHEGIPVNAVRIFVQGTKVAVGDFLPHGSSDLLDKFDALIDAVLRKLEPLIVEGFEKHIRPQLGPSGEFYLPPGDSWELHAVGSGV